jgi:hypothetical protein
MNESVKKLTYKLLLYCSILETKCGAKGPDQAKRPPP